MADQELNPLLGAADRRELMRQANRMRGKLIDLELVLSVNNLQDELAKVREQEKKLSAEIRQLRIQIASDWRADASELLPQIAEANSQIQRAIRDLSNKAETASRIAKVIGLVGKTVGLVGGILA